MARWLVIACVLVACSRASDETGSKQLQDQPPPKQVVVPPGLSISVEVDGAAKAAITTDTLDRLKPDFSDVDRRAWLIPTLVADASPVGSVVEASTPGGVSVKFAHPTTDGFEPVLFLTRRGEVIVSAIDPKDPFPRYHGQGGRLHRAGDSMPRVAPVTKLSITHPKP
ncbi:MAG: hypothetical protein JWO36_472 [Myxococcales bacterium]|nr:hypothetical protein [Myxococcales bacterium]